MLALVLGALVVLVLISVALGLRSQRAATTAPPPVRIDTAQVRALAQSGELIEAIKLYRAQTGLGLREAKEAVEAMRDGRPPPAALHPGPELVARVTELAVAGRTIEAIKLYREKSGVGLKEAKDFVDALLKARP